MCQKATLYQNVQINQDHKITQVTKSGIAQWKNDKRKIDEGSLQLYGLVKKATEDLWIKLVILKN